MKFRNIAIIATLATVGISGSAMAQSVGDTVYGPQGNEVGTIESLEGGNVTINTGNLMATLPASMLGANEKGPAIGWNKADLEAAITAAQQQAAAQQEAAAQAAEQEAAAQLAAAIAVGTSVQTIDPLPLGTIDTIEGDNVILVREDESLVTLPKNVFALDAEGNLVARLTMAQLEAALAGQAGG